MSWRRNCRTFTYTYYVTLLVCCTYAVHVIRIRFDCGINTRCLASRPVLNPPLFRQSLVEPRRTTILPTHFGAVTGTSAILSYPATKSKVLSCLFTYKSPWVILISIESTSLKEINNLIVIVTHHYSIKILWHGCP